MINIKKYSRDFRIFESKGNNFELPKLGYRLDSIAPFIDKATMEEHFNVHFRGYTDKLNECIKEENIYVSGGGQEEMITEILRNVRMYSEKLRNNGGGFYNHLVYFENISPIKKNIQPKTKGLIIDNFGSYSEFKKKFTEAGLGRFGSGWVWLVKKGNSLEIVTTPNQDSPIMDIEFFGEVLIGMDVWEHSYYLKHKADRKSYIFDFFEIIDWEVVDKRIK